MVSLNSNKYGYRALAVIAAAASLIGAATIGWHGHASASGFSGGMVSLTFDDGLLSQSTLVRSELATRSQKGTFYVVKDTFAQGWSGYMTVDQLRQIQTDGNEIGAHSVTHRNLTTLSSAELTAELADSKSYFETTFGEPVTTFASPFGAFTPAMLPEFRKYFKLHRTVNPGLVSSGSFIDEVPSYDIHTGVTVASVKALIDKARTKNSWAVLTFHDIVTSGAQSGTQYDLADFRAVLDYIKTSGVRVVTVRDGAALMSGTTTPVEVGTTIYDEMVHNGFADWSWAVHDGEQDVIVQSGAASMSFEPDEYKGLLFHTPGVPASTYSGLEFWAHGGTTGGQNVNIALRNGGLLGQISLSQAVGGPLPANTWTKVVIPFSAMGVSPSATLTDLYFEDPTGADQATMYLDNIRLMAASEGPSTTTIPTTTTIPAPVRAGLAVYDDAVRNEFQDWSWATHNLSATQPVRTGTNSISVEPDNWAALYFHHAGVDATQYSALSFWVNASGPGGQKLAVSFYDGTTEKGRVLVDTLLGGPLPANTWKEVVVPLSSVGSSTGLIKDIYIQDTSGVDQLAIAIDDVRLDLKSNATTTVAPTTVAPTTVPPTTVPPSTVAPTTVAPTTIPPTTVPPTTVAPTTVAPTTTRPPTTTTTVAPTTTRPPTTTTTTTPQVMTLTSSASTVRFFQPFVLTASGLPSSGTVSFAYQNGSRIGTTTVVNGKATLTALASGLGRVTIVATWSGGRSASTTINVTF